MGGHSHSDSGKAIIFGQMLNFQAETSS